MKKKYVRATITIHNSLQEITMLTQTEAACNNQGSGCSGSCFGVTGMSDRWPGYKEWDCR